MALLFMRWSERGASPLRIWNHRRIGSLAGVAAMVLAAGCASPSPVGIGEVEPTTPVRFEVAEGDDRPSRAGPETGHVHGYDSERIYISLPGRSHPDTIRWEHIEDLRASTGPLRGLGLLRGAGIGLAIGTAAVVVAYQQDPYAALALVQAPAITIPVGALLGAVFAPEAWAPVEGPRGTVPGTAPRPE